MEIVFSPACTNAVEECIPSRKCSIPGRVKNFLSFYPTIYILLAIIDSEANHASAAAGGGMQLGRGVSAALSHVITYDKNGEAPQRSKEELGNEGGEEQTWRRQNAELRCRKCGRKGHIARYCRFGPKCNSCGQRGHIERFCRSLRWQRKLEKNAFESERRKFAIKEAERTEEDRYLFPSDFTAPTSEREVPFGANLKVRKCFKRKVSCESRKMQVVNSCTLNALKILNEYVSDNDEDSLPQA